MSTEIDTSRTPTLGNLIGSTKNSSDITSRPVRIPYNQSTTIQEGSNFTLHFGKSSADEFLDTRSVYLRTRVNFHNNDPNVNHFGLVRQVLEDRVDEWPSDLAIALDSNHISSIFSRIIIKSGSTTIYEMNQNDLIMNFLNNVHVSNNEGEIDQMVAGQTFKTQPVLAWRHRQQCGGEYIFKFTPKGTLLNCDSLLPMSSSRYREDLSVQFYLKTFGETFTCMQFPGGETDGDAINKDGLITDKISFFLTDTEIMSNYLSSPSISSYFNTNAWQMSVDSYNVFFENIQTPQSILKFGTSLNSVSKIVTFFRKGDGYTTGRSLSDFHTKDKLDKTINRVNLLEYALYINNSPKYDEPITNRHMGVTWKDFKACYPEVSNSKIFDNTYFTNNERFVLVQNLQSCPTAFHKHIDSGLQTSSLNNPLYCKISLSPDMFDGSKIIRADSFLISEGIVYMVDGTLRFKN